MPLRAEDGLITGIFGITRDITDRKEAELRTERYVKLIHSIKEELESDARMAGQLQRSFFPTGYPGFPEGVAPADSCVEFLHHFSRCTLVSGDYCAINRVSDSKVGILLCDVLGTGARAALVAALIRGIMQEIEPLSDDPPAYLGRMNELLYPLLHSDPDHLLMEVTACYMVLDITDGLIRAASAAHPLPLHFRKGQPVKWLFENLVLRGPALAVEPESRFHPIECRVGADDTVVLFTDGLASVRNSLEEPFCEQRLLSTAQKLAGNSLGDIYRGLEGAAANFSKNGHLTDDVCLVGFHLRNLLGTA
jgi:sigma-B regulation protein RsbU (phosphoserine phosphatase)